MSDKLSIAAKIRQVADDLEKLPANNDRTREAACLLLAWGHLVDAHNLLTLGRLSPDDMVWAWNSAAEIESKANDTT